MNKDDWIKINPIPDDYEECEILLKSGKIISGCSFELNNKIFHHFTGDFCGGYSINSVDSWRRKYQE